MEQIDEMDFNLNKVMDSLPELRFGEIINTEIVT